VSQAAALDVGGGSPAARAGTLAALVGELETGARSGFPRAPTGGIIFQRLAYPVLSAANRTDLALQMLLARGMPSIAFWMDAAVQTTPATTLWERWGSTATVPQGVRLLVCGGGGREGARAHGECHPLWLLSHHTLCPFPLLSAVL
jgi:hypothetical protein